MPDKLENNPSRDAAGHAQARSRGRKIVLWVFIIWAAQAIPKWIFAIVADGETSAAIMRFFVPPRR